MGDSFLQRSRPATRAEPGGYGGFGKEKSFSHVCESGILSARFMTGTIAHESPLSRISPSPLHRSEPCTGARDIDIT